MKTTSNFEVGNMFEIRSRAMYCDFNPALLLGKLCPQRSLSFKNNAIFPNPQSCKNRIAFSTRVKR